PNLVARGPDARVPDVHWRALFGNRIYRAVVEQLRGCYRVAPQCHFFWTSASRESYFLLGLCSHVRRRAAIRLQTARPVPVCHGYLHLSRKWQPRPELGCTRLQRLFGWDLWDGRGLLRERSEPGS